MVAETRPIWFTANPTIVTLPRAALISPAAPAAFAAAFGAIQQTPRIVPGLAEVRTLPRPAQEQTVSAVQSFQEFGGLAGRFLLAFLAVRIVSRRRLLRLFQVPGLVIVAFVFAVAGTSSLTWLKWASSFTG